MTRNSRIGYAAMMIVAGAGIAACRTSEPGGGAGTAPTATGMAPTALMPSTMARVGMIDERFQSYNVEMLEVTGGKFWKPYKAIGKPAAQAPAASGSEAQGGETPGGMSADLYQYRPPLDLTNRRLRAMARALGPAYMRISGTWANTSYFADTDPPPRNPPKGYGGVLTRQQWLGAIDFSRAVDAPIVTSMPNGTGTRGPDGLWRPDQARRWLAFTKANGGTVAAAEFFNEPTLASMGGAPKGYNAAAFGRDYRVFNAFMRKEYPGTKLLAPGSVGEANADWAVATGGYGDLAVLPAAALAASTGDADAFSYHHYGAVSQRCAAMGHQTSADQALSEDWLGRTDQTLAFYRGVRDKAMPGKPFWNTETADAACGGNPWAGTFLDTFRYLDQLGRLARQQVDVVIHNTLVASDYGLLDENSFAPKPKFWGALLWRKLMGTTVLDPGVPIAAGLHVYAHCLRGVASGVALMVINTDINKARAVKLPVSAMRYTLRAPELQGTRVELNGKPLELGPDDSLPALAGTRTPAGDVSFGPASITFLALPDAANGACR
jgi:heparanase 1